MKTQQQFDDEMKNNMITMLASLEVTTFLLSEGRVLINGNLTEEQIAKSALFNSTLTSLKEQLEDL